MVGGKGDRRCELAGGKKTLLLQPEAGLRELKAAIRKAFGLYASHKLSKLLLVVDGAERGEAKKADLVQGATVRCTYVYAHGNAANLRGGRRGGFGGFGRGGACGVQMMRMMLAMGYGGGRFAPGPESDCSDCSDW